MVEPIELDSDLYALSAVEAAAEAFAGIAQIKIERRGEMIVATVTDARPDLAERLTDEFCDQALFRTIQLARWDEV